MNFILLCTIIGLALTFDYINGFHDAANSISTIVTTKVLRPLQAVCWAAFFNFAAFWVFGFGIADTIAKTADTTKLSLVAILAGILAAIIWDLFTWLRGIPSSSSHTLIGGFLGAAITHAGFNSIVWFKPSIGGYPPTGVIVMFLFIFLAPLVGLLVAYLLSIWMLRCSQKGIIPKLFSVLIAAFTIWFVSSKVKIYNQIHSPKILNNHLLSILVEPENIRWFLVAFVVLTLCFFSLFFSSMSNDRSEKWLRKMQLISSASFSLGHGGNDAQKVMGLIAASVIVYGNTIKGTAEKIPDWLHIVLPGPNVEAVIPQWIPLACYTVIGIGTMSGGWKIIKTMGTKITKITPFEGVIAESAGALTLYLTEYFKVPVSTTHTITGSIIGAGLTKRLSAIRWALTGKIFWAWILTIPCSAAIASLLYLLLKLFIK
jgi:inorganic phosphate transporter, PiT family